jgi:hypothetical protein
VSSRGLKHDSLQDIRNVFRGLRLIEIAACKAAGKSEMDHESATDFEATSGRLELPFSSAPLLTFDGEGIRRTLMSRFTLGLVLLILGVGLLLVGGISYTTQDRTKIGPIAIEYPEQHRIPYSPLAGGLLAVAGGALMLTGRAKSHPA